MLNGPDVGGIFGVLERRFRSKCEEWQQYTWDISGKVVSVMVANAPLDAGMTFHLYGTCFVVEHTPQLFEARVRVKILGGEGIKLRGGGGLATRYEQVAVEFLKNVCLDRRWKFEEVVERKVPSSWR